MSTLLDDIDFLLSASIETAMGHVEIKVLSSIGDNLVAFGQQVLSPADLDTVKPGVAELIALAKRFTACIDEVNFPPSASQNDAAASSLVVEHDDLVLDKVYTAKWTFEEIKCQITGKLTRITREQGSALISVRFTSADGRDTPILSHDLVFTCA